MAVPVMPESLSYRRKKFWKVMVASVLFSLVDLDALLGLDGLMQTLVIAAAVHEAAGEFVDDDDLAVLDDVVDVALHDAAGLHGLIDVVRRCVAFSGVGQVFHAEELLGLGDALLR